MMERKYKNFLFAEGRCFINNSSQFFLAGRDIKKALGSWHSDSVKDIRYNVLASIAATHPRSFKTASLSYSGIFL